MNRKGLLAFLSVDSVQRHEEYFKDLKLRYSILKKSYPSLSDKGVREIARMSIDADDRNEAAELFKDISSHECYFESFCENPRGYKPIKRYYSSEAAFVYEIFVAARSCKSSFIYVYKNKRGAPVISEQYLDFPIFAIDLCEHAYIFDYGFSRDEYLRHALGFIDLQKLSLEPLDNTEKNV